jgi:hypothetical protein
LREGEENVLIKEEKTSKRELVPAGMYLARCYMVVDLGTQRWDYQGQEKTGRKIMFGWEIPKIRRRFEKDGVNVDLPAAIYEKFTCSLGEKSNLRKKLKSWRGRDFTAEELAGFEIRNVLGKPCLLNVSHSKSADGTKVYDNIDAITPLMDGMTPHPAENPNTYYSIDDNGWNIPDTVYEWLVKMIKDSDEWKQTNAPAPAKDVVEEHVNNTAYPVVNDDDVPF